MKRNFLARSNFHLRREKMIQNRCHQKIFIFIFSALLTVFFSYNSYGYMWKKTLGGSGSGSGNSVQQTTDGGFIIAGYTSIYGAGNRDVYLIKTDGLGNLVWENTFGGIDYDNGESVQQTTDGGFIIAGSTKSYGAGVIDVYLIKTDGLGNLVWENTFGGNDGDIGHSVQQTTDGGFIISGVTWSYGAGLSDVYLIKTDASGNLVWEKTFGGTGGDWGQSVQQTTDGGFIIAGGTDSYGAGNRDVYLIKTDASGNLVWEKTFGGSYHEFGYSVQQTTDGGFIISGDESSFGAGGYDVYLIKTDASGNLVWEKTFGGTGSDRGRSVQQTTDGGYIIVRTHIWWELLWVYYDLYLIKTDSSGNLVWEKTLGRKEYSGNSVQQTTDGGYIIAGWTGRSGSSVSLIYYKVAWETVYNTLFDSPSDLELLRQYRHEILSNTTRGVIYKTLLYNSSEEALKVMLNNPELMSQAKALIETNRYAVLDVLDGYEGVIYNTDEILAFLDAYAKKAPQGLKLLAKLVQWDMLRKQEQRKLFHGFRLK
jgi:hypothetical protein